MGPSRKLRGGGCFRGGGSVPATKKGEGLEKVGRFRRVFGGLEENSQREGGGKGDT